MSFLAVFNSVFIMGLMIVIGFILHKYISFNQDIRQLFITLIVNIAMPCIILSSLFQFAMDGELLQQIGLIFVIALFVHCLGIGIGFIVSKIVTKNSRQKNKEMALLAGLGNTGFIGIPLCAALFGAKGALFAAVFDAGLDMVIFTVGVFLLEKKQKLFSMQSLKSLINIPTITIVLGMTVSFLQLQPPSMITELTEKLANLASPLAMIYIGLLIPSLWKKRKKIGAIDLGVPIGLKLFILPVVVTIGLLYFLPLDETMTNVILVQASMPVFTLSSILFAKYKANEEYAATATVYATLFSLITIPIMVYSCSLLLY